MAYEKIDPTVDLNDERLQTVLKEGETEQAANTELKNRLLENSAEFYADQKASIEAGIKEQEDILNQQTDFTVKQIEQKKEQAQKDLEKEQAAAYGDYRKQINPYGVNAEIMASAGLTNSGYSETSKVAIYNAYQNRVATARAVYETAKTNYEIGIQEAKIQNSVALAEIRANALKQQLEFSLQEFQHNNSLILDFADREAAIKERTATNWRTILDQINTEKAFAEEQNRYQAELEALKSSSIIDGDKSETKEDNDKIYDAGEFIGQSGLSNVGDNKTPDASLPINEASLERAVKELELENPTAEEIKELIDKKVIKESEYKGEIIFEVDEEKAEAYAQSKIDAAKQAWKEIAQAQQKQKETFAKAATAMNEQREKTNKR
jgi:hypothetical protein